MHIDLECNLTADSLANNAYYNSNVLYTDMEGTEV